MNKILIATTNPGKREEFISLLVDLPVRLVFPMDLGIDLKVDETGSTYSDNAILKAKEYCQAANMITIADDSGLEVDALEGAPGIYSARYSKSPGATDAIRRAFLLENLKVHPRPWRAAFHAVVAIALPPSTRAADILIEVFQGICPGEIVPEERGTNGFGYDPIFYIPEQQRTMAELSMDQKNKISHRALALQASLPALRKICGI